MLLPIQSDPTAVSPLPMDANLVVTVGTAFQDLVVNLLQHLHVLVLVIDVQYELDKLVIPELVKHRVVLLPVGNHMTVQQLVEAHGTDAQQQALTKLPAMSASDGLAQVPCGGVAAVRELLSRMDVQQWLEDVVPQLIQQANGNVPQVRIRKLAGTAGGTASQGAIVFLGALLTILQESGITSVDIAVHLIGGISFAGPRFARTQQNAACSLVSWLKQIRSESDISVTYHMSVFEVQPVGDDRALRNRLIADQQSALHSPDVQDHIRQVRSNHAAGGELGNVVQIQTRNHQPISDEQISNDVAAEYLPVIESLLRTVPAFSQISGLRFDYEDSRQQPQSAEELIDQLLDTAEDDGDEETLLDLIDPGLSFASLELHADMRSGTSLPTGRLTEHFSRTPGTPTEFQQQLAQVMAIHERCADDLQASENLAAELQISLDDAIEDFLKAVRKAVSPPRFSCIGIYTSLEMV